VRIHFDDWLLNTGLSPLIRLCCALGIRPNAVTSAGLLLGAAVPVLDRAGRIPWAAAALLLRQFLDCLDGAIARRCRRESRLGAVLDSVSDGVFYFVLLWLLMARLSARIPVILALTTAAFAVLAALHVGVCSVSALTDHSVKTYETPSRYRRTYAFLVNNSLPFTAGIAALYLLTAG
jgi:CDP-diacylglycerol--serine O-phosphatidyltransferase